MFGDGVGAPRNLGGADEGTETGGLALELGGAAPGACVGPRIGEKGLRDGGEAPDTGPPIGTAGGGPAGGLDRGAPEGGGNAPGAGDCINWDDGIGAVTPD